ncbi:hypothetical protein D9758_002217 [Tetrapyrgos nigripes]|uniref:Copper homeostasis protein cutC homolog n=1 Tax=Tetrapyrgos nigripes TaxID=182062 RepID=A0A8H5GP53_9AGAR|nr:hypothetical protein D9758_002217 [Tetrapyrgos nigripes]
MQLKVSAVRGGANRLELCGNLGLGGGTTPSLGLLTAVQKAVGDIPIMVGSVLQAFKFRSDCVQAMVRPRTGDFLYTDEEIDVMIEDVKIFKNHGVQGVVFGVLTADGRVDEEKTKRLVQASLPLERHLTCPETLKKAGPGVTRILTSGQGSSVPVSIETLQSLFQMTQAMSKEGLQTPTIMPGSGINAKTIGTVLDALLPLGVSEVHMSGGSWVEGKMAFRREGMGMGVGGSGDWSVWLTSEIAVREVRDKLDAHNHEE